MEVSYWDCEFSDYEEDWDSRWYGCTNPDNPDSICDLSNKFGDSKEDCPYLGINQPNQQERRMDSDRPLKYSFKVTSDEREIQYLSICIQVFEMLEPNERVRIINYLGDKYNIKQDNQ